MNNTQRIVQVDKSGQARVTIPKTLANALGWGKGTSVEFRLGQNKSLVITRVQFKPGTDEAFRAEKAQAQQFINDLKDEQIAQQQQ